MAAGVFVFFAFYYGISGDLTFLCYRADSAREMPAVFFFMSSKLLA